jgi:ATP-binding cassette subfamily B protein/subfamily B ATP-binding cassette protein MsbA
MGTCMHNFFRALRFAWPYRWWFFLSLGSAFMVAVLWGANLSSIFPFLKLLNENKTPHIWADEQVKQLGESIQKINQVVDDLERKQAEVEKKPPGGARDKELAHTAGLIAREQQSLAELERAHDWAWKLKRFVDNYCPPDKFQFLLLIMVLVVIGVMIKGVFDFCQETLVGGFVYRTIFDLRNRLYRQVLRQDLSQFGKEGAASLMSRFTNDAETVANGMRALTGRMIVEPLKALVCIIIACTISWRLTVLFLVLIPIAVVFMAWVGRTLRRASRRVLRSMASLFKILQEGLQGIGVVKAFTAERHERRRLFLGGKDFIHKAMHVVRLEALTDPIMEVMAVAAVAAALLVGSYLVISGQERIFNQRLMNENTKLDAASLLWLYGMLVATADPLRKLTSVFSKLQAAAAASDRIFEIMDRMPKVNPNQNAPRLPRHHKQIEFADICFGYTPNHPILKHVSFTINHGETVAIVGKNGCGKTTLMSLLCRFYDPDYGSIVIDGQNLREVNVRSWRSQIGYVTQHTVLFDDTVRANIAYGKRHASQQEIEAAAKRAHAHEFIANFPRGYDTIVGEMGHALSGGQRQRIALARAILRDPALLILDEATSAADAESEQGIHEALQDFAVDRTTFLITHRLSSLKIANRIIVLNSGAIEAIGTHEQLICTCETYQRLQDAFTQRWAA